MRTYLIRRLFFIIPTLLLVTVIVFMTIRLIPGSVIDMMLQEMMGASGGVAGAGQALDREAIEHLMGLDLPIHVQYARWMGNMFQGDFGQSLWVPVPVGSLIAGKLPVSLELGLLGLIVGLLIALPIGIVSAIRQDSFPDYFSRGVAIALIAVPGFWIGTMVMVYPSIWWGWSPPMQYVSLTEDPLGNLGMMIIPAALLGMAMSGTTMRMTRTMMLEVLRQDYIRTAWAKGLKERVIVFRHTMKNAMIPVITIVGLQLPVLLGGTVIIEQIFNLPGIGRLMLTAIGQRDYAVVSAVNVMIAVFVLLVNVVVDISYAFLDPRIQLS